MICLLCVLLYTLHIAGLLIQMKGDIAGAHKSLAAYTKSRTTVGKSRKSYRHSCAELVEAKCEVERAKLEGVGKGKEMDKLETKVRKATAHMESACESACLSVCLSMIVLAPFSGLQMKAAWYTVHTVCACAELAL